MEGVIEPKSKDLFRQWNQGRLIAVCAGIVVIVAGYFVVKSFGAGFFVAEEAEKGSLVGAAQVVTDSTASGGKAIAFNAPTAPPPPPPATASGYPYDNNTGVPQGKAGDTRPKVVNNPDGKVPVWTLLKPYTGPMTITTDGTVIDGVYINDRGTLTINAKNVVIKNSYIRILNFDGSNNKEAVRTYNDNANLLIVDTEISGATEDGRPSDSSGGGQPLVSRTGYTLLRTNLHDYGDIIRMDGRATIQDSWLHTPRNAAGADPHNDIMQSTNATYIRILHNRLDHTPGATQTSCILLKADIGPISDVVVDGNLINGGGYSVYWYDAGYKSTNGRFTNNRWQRSPTGGMWPKGGYWGPWATNSASTPVWSNNVWDDNGAPISL